MVPFLGPNAESVSSPPFLWSCRSHHFPLCSTSGETEAWLCCWLLAISGSRSGPNLQGRIFLLDPESFYTNIFMPFGVSAVATAVTGGLAPHSQLNTLLMEGCIGKHHYRDITEAKHQAGQWKRHLVLTNCSMELRQDTAAHQNSSAGTPHLPGHPG